MVEASFRNLVVEAFGAYCLMYLRLVKAFGGAGIGGLSPLVEYSLQIALLIWFG